MKLTKEQIIDGLKEMSMLELNDLVKAIEEAFGVTAAAPAAAGAAAAAPAAALATEVTVHLKDAGQKKVEVIKVVREITGLGLMEAKKLVDSAPSVIKADVKRDLAEEMKKKFEAAGAVVHLA